MSQSSLLARAVALVGAAALQWRRLQGQAPAPAFGLSPLAAPGLKVNAFATGLKHPRWIHVLPDGAVTVAEERSAHASSPAACATRWAWPGSRTRARRGRW